MSDRRHRCTEGRLLTSIATVCAFPFTGALCVVFFAAPPFALTGAAGVGAAAGGGACVSASTLSLNHCATNLPDAFGYRFCVS